jgi:2-aminoadipate transaminase
VRLIRRVYRERRDVMLSALQEFFPEECTWTRPQGGLFLWVTLPDGLHASKLFRTALEENVAFVPGESFYAVPDTMGDRQLRLNFSNATPEKIREGIRRLANAVKRQMVQAGLVSAVAVPGD